MHIFEVQDSQSRKEFLEVPKQLYKNDPHWVCPLDAEIEGIFDPSNNPCFNYGEAIRWVLKNDDDHLIGRIAAFYDTRKSSNSSVPNGYIGFFECIHQQEAANLLFDTAKQWLEGKGMKAMDGSANFGENLFNWGVLVEGFQQQSIGMPYNFAYYKELFENYGFQEYFQQLSYLRDIEKEWPERQYKFADFITRRPEYTFEHFQMAKKEKYIQDLVDTYNTVWSDFHEDYIPLETWEIRDMFDDVKDILDEELIWFAYDRERPIGMVIGLPDVNPVLKKLGNGKLHLFNKLKLAFHLKMNKSINGTRTIASGVIPEYQQKGIIAALFLKLDQAMRKKGQKYMHFAWTGDYNSPVLKIYEYVGAQYFSTHITYRYMLDDSIPFKRFTNEEGYKARKKKN